MIIYANMNTGNVLFSFSTESITLLNKPIEVISYKNKFINIRVMLFYSNSSGTVTFLSRQ